jgi:hypothetical protein
VQPTFPNASVSKAEYHALRRRLHQAQIEDRFAAAAKRSDDEYADRRSSLTNSGYSAVDATLSGYSYELRWLLQVTRFVPVPSGRLTNLGPRSHVLRCQIAQNLRKRQLALVVANSVAQSQALSARIARENAQRAAA